MQKATDQSKMDQISSFLERIDDDQDGHLKVDDVLKVIRSFVIGEGQTNSIHQLNCSFQIFETIGKENINLNPKQVDELLDLISKEEYLENEEKIQKALEKSKEEREQRELEKNQSKSAAAEDEAVEKADDQKHIMDAEKTPTFESTVSRIPSIFISVLKCIRSNCFSLFLRGSNGIGRVAKVCRKR